MTGSCYDGTNDFKWLIKNKPLGDNLDVLEISSVSATEKEPGKTAFDVIDETLYSVKFDDIKDKIAWVCSNFDKTQKVIESDKAWLKRITGTHR